MSLKSIYSFTCAALAATVAAGSLAGCFSEHVEVTAPTGQELCTGALQPNVVRIIDFAFQPAQLAVTRGATVTFVNCGQIQHTSTSDTGAWDSGLLSTHATFEREFTTAGPFPFRCIPHPSMRGTVTVN
jgi:plastocyanin